MSGRNELLAWLNELLQLNYSKVEQCGSGAAYLGVLDSIYGDLPMSRVKLNARTEPEYVQHFKILQSVFKAKKIDKDIPVDRLIKCKNLDNLEFLQWIKKFWEANYAGQGYDPVARRRGVMGESPAGAAGAPAARSKPAGTTGMRPVGTGAGGSASNSAAIAALQAQVAELSGHLEGLEKERDFYFAKLRDIEILVQAQLEVVPTDETLGEIQKILYSTEDGFEVPEGEGLVDEEETF